MKIFKLFSLICGITLLFSACETYGDPEVEYSSIFPMSGEWIVTAKDLNTNVVVDIPGYTDDKFVLRTYNTADESTSQMWLAIANSYGLFAVKGKININLSDYTFSVSNIQNVNKSVASKFSISDGKITLNGVTPPEGGKADAIYFKVTSDAAPGITYEISGYRRTGWPSDEATPADAVGTDLDDESLIVLTTTSQPITFNIISGNGDYTVDSDNVAIATATMATSTSVTVTPIAEGITKINISDKEQQGLTIIVKVTAP